MNIIASIGAAPVVFFVVMAGLYLAWHFARSRSLLQRWAASNGYEIIHSELRDLQRGPFLGSGSAKQSVYYVRVRGQDGRERSGWIRCGGFWSGLLSVKTEVRWEDRP
jgi:cell division protein FtsW (lipid II flippase)